MVLEEGVHLVVTSPPYPMIEMWDDSFSESSPEIKDSLDAEDGRAAFEAMHGILDAVWASCKELLTEGGFLCINIGDATRTIGKRFALYPNHTRVTQACLDLGFTPLPGVLWRKQTNAPNKFMGSGMLPAGAYVTLEHEYVLVFRKGGKREFRGEEEGRRRGESAFFWEERNRWFSDLWDFQGTPQKTDDPDIQRRSAAFPMELPVRLISMYSVYDDTVLDPFVGTGTTSVAALTLARNSVGFDTSPEFCDYARRRLVRSRAGAQQHVRSRIRNHLRFLTQESTAKRGSYRSHHYGFPVVTQQETQILLYEVSALEQISAELIRARHSPITQASGDMSSWFQENSDSTQLDAWL